MKSEKVEQKQHFSEYHSKELDKRLEEIRSKRSVLEQNSRQDFNMTYEEVQRRNIQILKELAFSQERVRRTANDNQSNSRLKIMEKNYWSFVRSIKPLWEREISPVIKKY